MKAIALRRWKLQDTGATRGPFLGVVVGALCFVAAGATGSAWSASFDAASAPEVPSIQFRDPGSARNGLPTVNGTWVKTIDTSLYTPSSPDPSGIVYLQASDRFLISDSEVDEMPLYQGANLYLATRSGSGAGTGTTLPWSHEPTGLGYDPATKKVFVSDDDLHVVHVDLAGADGRYGTADDTVTRFDVSAFGSLDSEDDVYDVTTGHLFISDGVGLEVYDVDPVNGVFGDGNDVVTHFDVQQYGARDAEGIGMDEQSGHLLVVDPTASSLFELAKSGALIRIIDCHSVPETSRAMADVTMAPTSDPDDPPGRLDYWIVDRRVDNGPDPNENDGRLYEVSAPHSVASPLVSVTAPAEGARVTATTTIDARVTTGAALTHVAFAIDGIPVGTDTNGADGWAIAWNTRNVADGAHTVSATAVDAYAQTGSDSNTFTVDNTAPTVTLTAPAPGTAVKGVIALKATASDFNGISSVAFSVDDAAVGTGSNGADGWSLGWDTRGVRDGAHTVTAKATDSVGQSATDSHDITTDTHAPSRLTVRGPRRTTRSRVTYRLSAADAVTPARKLRFLCALDRRRLRACGARHVVRLSRGRHVLRVAARDEIGNTSRTATVRLRRR
jgi:Bacterial Ig domain